MLNIVSWAKTGSVWCWHIWTCSVCVTGKRERVRCSHIWTCSLRYRQKGKSVMLTFLNMFTVLQAKHREYDAHIFEASEAEAAMVRNTCFSFFWQLCFPEIAVHMNWYFVVLWCMLQAWFLLLRWQMTSLQCSYLDNGISWHQGRDCDDIWAQLYIFFSDLIHFILE